MALPAVAPAGHGADRHRGTHPRTLARLGWLPVLRPRRPVRIEVRSGPQVLVARFFLRDCHEYPGLWRAGGVGIVVRALAALRAAAALPDQGAKRISRARADGRR